MTIADTTWTMGEIVLNKDEVRADLHAAVQNSDAIILRCFQFVEWRYIMVCIRVGRGGDGEGRVGFC